MYTMKEIVGTLIKQGVIERIDEKGYLSSSG